MHAQTAAPIIIDKGSSIMMEVCKDRSFTFQPNCSGYSGMRLIELTNIKGNCHIYASDTEQNPGSLDNSAAVLMVEDSRKTSKILRLSMNQTPSKAGPMYIFYNS